MRNATPDNKASTGKLIIEENSFDDFNLTSQSESKLQATLTK